MTHCQIPNCFEPAHWRCSSGFRFCKAHKRSHGVPPHTFKRYIHPTKPKRTAKIIVSIIHMSISRRSEPTE